MQQTIERIDRLMAPMLNDEQASELHTVLVACLTEKGGNPGFDEKIKLIKLLF